ncbi:hypothetical protein [Chryseobacterium sp. RLHN22]|uniref:hypothetical protein n=1 Tax=Chryseobacterium sp. RLHN22 TaxID=3437885 RepID=UPI003D9AEA36
MITITNDQIATIENNREWCENIHFNDFLLALIKVDPKYLLWPYGMKEQMCERVFAYELYHQWRIVSEIYQYENLIINGEIRKDGSIYRENINIVYPDLILHEQQNNMNQQILACEIKTIKAVESTGGSNKVKKDLFKLDNYIKDLNYQICAFIQIKGNIDISEKVIKYLKTKKNEFVNLSKIYYIIKEDDYISYESLENLLA